MVIPKRRVVAYALLGALGLLWFIYLAPTSLGGGTSYIRVAGHSMDPTYATGDVVIQRQKHSYQVGDIVAFKAQGGQVIHRVVGGNERDGYVMRGDNKPDADPWRPKGDDILGASWIHLPGVGKYLDILTTPMFAGIAGGLLALAVLDTSSPKKRRDETMEAVR